MPEKDQQIFFVDDELVERLMRGDAIEGPAKKQHSADSSALAQAVRLASESRLDALTEPRRAADRSEKSAEYPQQDRALLGQTLALQSLAAEAFSRGDYNAAVQHCSQIIKVSTDSYEGWFNLGVACQKTGAMEQAGHAYREAARLRPQSAEAHLNLGVVLQERGDLTGAHQAYDRALASAPDTPGALWNLGLLAEGEHSLDQAEKYFERLVALKPDFEDAAFRLGFLQLQRGEFAGAVDNFELCVKQRGDWVEALLNLGLARWKFEDADAAARTFARVLALQPNHPGALRALTAIVIERKDYKQAWELQQKLTALGEDSVELSYNLGLLLQSAGENRLAAECYQILLKKKPGFLEALLNLGHALKAVGKDDESRRVWSEALAADAGLAAKYFH